MTPAATAPEIAVPRSKTDPDNGIHRTTLKGVRRFRVWWWEDGVRVSRLIRATTIEEARIERDRMHGALVAAGATLQNKGAKTPAARIRNTRHRGTGREAYIHVRVVVQGVVVGSFATMGEAVAARDAYLANQAELRRKLKALKKLRA